MKIALAFFGLPRCSRISFPSIAANLVAPLAAVGELRVFHHLWKQEQVSNLRSAEDHRLADANYAPFAAFEGEVAERPAAPAPLLQRIAAHGDAFHDGFQSLRNLLLQLESLYHVTQRVAAAQPDVVVFARPDLLYHEPLAREDVAYALAHPDSVSLPCWESWGGMNDRLAICGARAWRAYGGRLLLADHFCERTRRPLHSETFLAYAMAFAGVAVRTIALRASRVRVDGRIEQEDFIGARTQLLHLGPAGTNPGS
jgi:hypothetical protein